MFITLASEQFASWFSKGLTTKALSPCEEGGGREAECLTEGGVQK